MVKKDKKYLNGHVLPGRKITFELDQKAPSKFNTVAAHIKETSVMNSIKK